MNKQFDQKAGTALKIQLNAVYRKHVRFKDKNIIIIKYTMGKDIQCKQCTKESWSGYTNIRKKNKL